MAALPARLSLDAKLDASLEQIIQNSIDLGDLEYVNAPHFSDEGADSDEPDLDCSENTDGGFPVVSYLNSVIDRATEFRRTLPIAQYASREQLGNCVVALEQARDMLEANATVERDGLHGQVLPRGASPGPPAEPAPRRLASEVHAPVPPVVNPRRQVTFRDAALTMGVQDPLLTDSQLKALRIPAPEKLTMRTSNVPESLKQMERYFKLHDIRETRFVAVVTAAYLDDSLLRWYELKKRLNRVLLNPRGWCFSRTCADIWVRRSLHSAPVTS
jgi:hypothetical protein